MSVPPEVFDDDYLYFCEDVLGDERSDADAATVAELLGLERGMRVLDAPCGHGRIAGRLARLGCEVVGVDNSELFLGLARERYPDARFEAGDLRELAYDDEFDAVVNWFTSFGYFDPETNDRVLASFARALHPGGRLLLEVHNPERLKRAIEIAGGATAMVVEKDGDLLVDRVTFDAAASQSRTERWVVRGGRTTKLEFTLEQVPPAQLAERLRRAGFREVELHGAGGAEYEPDGPRLLAVATR